MTVLVNKKYEPITLPAASKYDGSIRPQLGFYRYFLTGKVINCINLSKYQLRYTASSSGVMTTSTCSLRTVASWKPVKSVETGKTR